MAISSLSVVVVVDHTTLATVMVALEDPVQDLVPVLEPLIVVELYL